EPCGSVEMSQSGVRHLVGKRQILQLRHAAEIRQSGVGDLSVGQLQPPKLHESLQVRKTFVIDGAPAQAQRPQSDEIRQMDKSGRRHGYVFQLYPLQVLQLGDVDQSRVAYPGVRQRQEP